MIRNVAFSLVLGAAFAPAPAPRQKPAEKTRLERVIQWTAKAGPAECKQLAGVLVDDSFDLRCRAASALYWKCDRAMAADLGRLLCRSLELGNAEAGAVLLLGYSKPDIATGCLRRLSARPEMVKLEASSRPVPIKLAVTVALARLGDREAVVQLRQAFHSPDLAATLFLLGVVRDIEDRQALREAVKLLEDGRECPGVLSHATRSVRDVALEALANRLSLRTSFNLEPGKRYEAGEIAEVRAAALAALAGARAGP
jgi:hypothetical protein